MSLSALLFLISMPGAGELIIVLVLLFSFVFWIAAIIDVARSRFDTDTTKITWLLIVILLGILGAIIYQFAGKRSRVY